MDKKTVWLWLSLLFGEGNDIYAKLLEHFEDEQNIYDSVDADVDLIHWLSESQKYKLLDKNLEHAEEILEWCEENEVEIIAYSDPKYPSALKKLSNFPPVLYCRGEFPNFNEELSISVVGTRSMTTYGQKIAFELGYTLSRGGAITVSGLARGIDCTVAHGTLNALGTTVAVLGSGIDVIYPRENASIMNRIIDYGAVITEFPPHTPPNARNFPIRNRIISGISNGTVIVEADENSGALITARQAMKQKKLLFAVPGPVKVHTSKGTNALIREEKAKVVRSAIDVFEEFLEEYEAKIDLKKAKQRPTFSKSLLKSNESEYARKARETRKAAIAATRKAEEILDEPTNSQAPDISGLTEIQLQIYNAMEKGETILLDELVERTKLTASELLANLSLMEIDGLIEAFPGNGFMKS